jgi:hypothetical protein
MSSKPIGALLALALIGGPVAAAAHPSPPSPPAKPHKCSPHAVAYRVSGSLASANLNAIGKHRASGTITITVTGANRAARNAGVTKGSTQIYTLTDVKVSYAHRLAQPNPPAGTRTVVKGTITVVARKCQDKSGAGQVTIEHVTFTPPPKSRT